MDSFSLTPPPWTEKAIHALEFNCPRCQSTAAQAKSAWINRRAPVTGEDYRRKWQEFYHCECDQVWWAWSSDRPQSKLTNPLE